jgi:ATP-dependent DNA ligase
MVPPGCVVDGEAVVWAAGRLNFEALQRRLSTGKESLRALVRELPASFAGFDVLCVAGHDTRALPLRDRRALLEELAKAWSPPLSLTPVTSDPEIAKQWMKDLTAAGIEGLIINSLLNERVDAGSRGACVVQGWRVFWVPAEHPGRILAESGPR